MRRGFLSFCGRVSRSRARLTRKNSLFLPSIARVASHFRKMRTPHFRGNAWQKCDFAALYRTLFDVPTAPQRLRCAALRLYEQTFHVPSRRVAVLRAHFTFLPWQKHFTFARIIYTRLLLALIRAKISRPKRRGMLSLIDIAAPRRTSGCSVTLPLALPAKIHPFPPALRSVRNSRPAQGNAWQKCDFAALYRTF